MRLPFAPRSLFLLLALLVTLVIFVQFGAFTLALDKLGLSAESGFLLLFVSLFGSTINLPLFSVSAEAPRSRLQPISTRDRAGQAERQEPASRCMPRTRGATSQAQSERVNLAAS